MNKAQLKAYFRGVLNRRDMTADQEEFYIQSALTRVARTLRTPGGEALVSPTVVGDYVELPTNFLELRQMSVRLPSGADRALQELDWATYYTKRGTGSTGDPKFFCRLGDRFYITPAPSVGMFVNLHYYADPQPLVEEIDENIITKTAPDLLMYAACAEACAFFVDDRLATFEGLFVGRLEEIKFQARESNIAGGSPALGLITTQEI